MAPQIPKKTAVELTFLDGSTTAFETTTYMCVADRIAFERRYQVSSTALMTMGQEIERMTAQSEDAAGVTVEVPSEMREEWIQFFTWRAAARAVPALAQEPFDAFIERLADMDMEEEDAEQDPTVPAPPTG